MSESADPPPAHSEPWLSGQPLRSMAIWLSLIVMVFVTRDMWGAWYVEHELAGTSPWWRSPVSPDGKLVVTCTGQGSAKVWRTDSGALAAEITGSWDPMFFHACFSPDGRRIVTGFETPYLTVGPSFGAGVWDIESGVRLARLWPPGMPDRVKANSGTLAVHWSPDGRRIATYTNVDDWRVGDPARAEGADPGDENVVTMWDAATFKPLVTRRVRTEVGQVSVRFSGDAKRLIVQRSTRKSHSGGGSGTLSEYVVELWDADTLETLRVLEGPLCGGSFAPDGGTVAAAGADGIVWMCDAETGRRLVRLEGHSAPAFPRGFSADGRLLSTEGTDKTVRVWDTRTGEEILRIGPPAGERANADLSLDGKRLFTSSFGHGGMNLWDVGTGELLFTFEHDLEKKGAGQILQRWFFTPDGRRLVIGDASVTRVWHRRRPERWWGVLWLPHSWIIAVLVVLLGWSFRRDERELRPSREAST